MLVSKFGGTSVGCAERIAGVAEIVGRGTDEELVVVVSAMSGTTSALIEGGRAAANGEDARYRAIQDGLLAKHLAVADELLGGTAEYAGVMAHIRERLEDYERLCRSIATLGEFTVRGSDAVACIGEEMSARILAALLRLQGRDAQAVSATALVRTNDHFGAATPDMAETRRLVDERLVPLVRGGTLPIVTGYIGSTAKCVTTTLGRGGSDYSAAILGASLDADEVCIWTDVNGILTADPKLVPDACTLTELTYAEAEELAYFGADVLHPKTIAPLAERGIPLRILNSFQPDHPGTLIVPESTNHPSLAPAIISTEGLSLIGVAGNGATWTLHMASRALQCLADAGVEVLMFSQSFSERNLNLVVRCRDQEHSVNLLNDEFQHDLQLGLLSRIGVEEEVATISVVGTSKDTSISSRAYEALGKLGLRVITIGQAASAYSVSFVIPETEVGRAVPFLHGALGL